MADPHPVPLNLHNHDEFKSAYDLYYKVVYKFIRGLVGDPHCSEELTQEVFIKVWRRPPTGTGSLQSYLLTTARTTVIDFLRPKKNQPTSGGDTIKYLADPQTEGDGTSVEGRAIKFADATDLIPVLEKLTDKQLEVVLLRFVMGLTLAEIADTLNTSRTTCKGRLQAAINKLRRVLVDEQGRAA